MATSKPCGCPEDPRTSRAGLVRLLNAVARALDGCGDSPALAILRDEARATVRELEALPGELRL